MQVGSFLVERETIFQYRKIFVWKHRGEKNFCDSRNDRKFEFMTSLAYLDFLGGSDSKESTCNAGDLGSIPGSGRSPGEENGNPLQYSYWRIPWTEEPGWLQSIGRVTKSQTQLSD